MSINGSQVLTNFDIIATAGAPNKAVAETFTATANGSGQITVAFSNGAANSPLVNGIEVFSNGTAIEQINCGELAGGTINVDSSNFLNQGAVQVSNGETLNLSGAWSNPGTITATAATLNLGGSFTTAGLGTVNGSGGTVNLTGTLNNAASTLTLNAATGSWNVVGGTIAGGTINDTQGAALVGTSSGGTLSGVTVSGPLDLTGVTTANSPSLTVSNGLTLNNATVLLGNAAGTTYGQMLFNNTETLGGTGTVVLGKNSNDELYLNSSFSTLTIGGGITVRGSDGSVYANNSNSTIVNQGAILADDSGGLVGNFVYDQSYSGGSTSSTANVITTSGVTNPAPQAVYQTCRAGTFSYTLSGLTAGASYTVQLDFADAWDSAAGQRQFNVSINGSQVLTNFDIIAVAGGANKAVAKTFTATANGSGQITVAFSNGAASSPLVNGIEVLSNGTAIEQINCGELAGGTINVNPSNFLNQGTVQAGNGETLNLSGAWSNTGTITATAATLNLGGSFTTAGLGTVNGSGGTVNLTGTLNNAASTLTLGPASGSWNLVGGTISGGTLSETGGAELVVTGSSGTLSGVTVSGPLDLTGVTTGNSPSLTVSNGLTLNNATVLLGNAAGTTYGQMLFNNTETLGGTGTVLLGKHSSDGLFVNSSSVLTIGPGITVRGSDGYLDNGSSWTGTIVNQGTISADDSGGLVGNFVYDQSYSGGSTTSTANVIATGGLAHPAPAAVYQTCRYGNFSYTLSGLTAGASYTVQLDFADAWASCRAAGVQREHQRQPGADELRHHCHGRGPEQGGCRDVYGHGQRQRADHRGFQQRGRE